MTASPEYIDLKQGMVLHVMPREGALTDAFAAVIRQVAEPGIHVDAPPPGGPALTPGNDVTLFVQGGGRIYRLESQVRLIETPALARAEAGEIAARADDPEAPRVMVLAHPTAADPTDRRQFYRLLTTITPRYAARVNAENDELERINTRILDLSGGGLQLHTRDWVPVGSRIRLVFPLEDDPQEVDACVLALSVVRPGPRRSLYRVHCRFVDMARAERERLVRFIFRKQIDFRQRGVG